MSRGFTLKQVLPDGQYQSRTHRFAFLLQVFISEQILYTRADLGRHMRSGDVEGAMAESGFKGHPQCKCVLPMRATSGVERDWESSYDHSRGWRGQAWDVVSVNVRFLE